MNAKNFFWFIVLNTALWGLISLVYFFTGGFYWDAPGFFFGVSSVFGHLLLFALGLSALVLPWRLIGPKTASAAAVAFGGFFTLFFAADAFVFTQYLCYVGASHGGGVCAHLRPVMGGAQNYARQKSRLGGVLTVALRIFDVPLFTRMGEIYVGAVHIGASFLYAVGQPVKRQPQTAQNGL